MSPAAPLTLGVAVPQALAGGGDGATRAERLRRYLTRAEALGLDGVWVSQPLRMPAVDPLVLLSFACAVTTTVRLGTAVLLTGLRPPLALARELASLDRLSGGRLDVGAGLGAPVDRALGLDPARRAERFEEGLRLLLRLWTEPAVTARSDWWDLDGVSAGVRPVQRPHPPLWIGARSGAALRRAAELGDGWIGSGASSAAQFSRSLAELRSHLDAAGRDAAGFRVAKRVYTIVTPRRGPALRRLEAYFAACYGDASLAGRAAVAGTAARCAEELGELVAAGADTLVVHPVFDHDEQLERLAADVRPLLEGALARGRA